MEPKNVHTGRKIVAYFLVLYKRVLSPLLPPACRFSPTCSEYMRLSVLKNGVFLGGLQGLLRLTRCHPWHPGGIDIP